MVTTSCTGKNSGFTPAEPTGVDSVLTPEIMWRLGRIGEFKVSPDKQTIVFTIKYTDIEADKNYVDIYTVPAAGGEITRLTNSADAKSQVGWRPDGQKITYLSSKRKNMQLWEMNPDGSEAHVVYNIKGDVKAYRYAPDMTHLLYVQRVKLDQNIKDLYPDLPKANARIETDLMYRHWNEWSDYSYNHVFVIGYKDGKTVGASTDIMDGERFHSPLMPFGGIEQIEWTADSKAVAYTCKKLVGKASALSTNSDIYLYSLADSTTRNLTEPNAGYDTNPSFSADGRFMMWLSMIHDGFESDKNRLMLMDLQSGQRRDLTAYADLTVASYCLADDARTAWFIANDKGTDCLYSVDIESGKIKQLSKGLFDYTAIEDGGNSLIASRMSMCAPDEIFAVDKSTGEAVNLSNVNAKALEHIQMGRMEQRWINTTDEKQMHTWVIYPPDFDPKKKYPALLYCQGGPQSTVSQFWSLRWNFQLMAANGYIVVAPNRRGLPGFGQEWNDQISGDYGGQCMLDYLSAIDSLKAEPYIDENRLGAVGASFGGYSVMWLAGNHEKRFKAFIAHCGIFNFDIMNVTTEELFFEQWDMKGMFWEYDNEAAMKSFAQSPHLFVNKWDTPILVIHGEQDFRIPYTQGMAAFNTAVMKDIPAEFLYFPDECHWVLRPQNSILWHREFYKWLDKWLK